MCFKLRKKSLKGKVQRVVGLGREGMCFKTMKKSRKRKAQRVVGLGREGKPEDDNIC